jgi:hypothetical protein
VVTRARGARQRVERAAFFAALTAGLALVVDVADGHAATIAAASCAQPAVQTALNQAQDGDTVVVPVGACTWTTFVRLSNAKGVTLLCASAGNCAITGAGTLVMFDTLSGLNSRFYRVSGFVFTSTSSTFIIWFAGDGTLERVRVDNNRFNAAAGSIAVFFGSTQNIGNYYGVIDHNTLVGAGSVMLVQIIGAVNLSPPASQAGTANNLFVEDNTITIQTMTNAGLGCNDMWGNGAMVWRRNSTLNCLVTSHGVTHSGGPQNFEFYDNDLRVDAGSVGAGVGDGYRLFHHQGSGEFIAFDNRFTAFSGKNGDPLEMTHYRSASPAAAGYATSLGRCDGTSSRDGNRQPTATYFGYPCWRQPGRDFVGNLKPMYVWNNRWADTGARIDMLVANPWGQSNPTVQDHIRPERDYYNAVSASAQTSATAPFTGAVGMGFGTLARRPTTCTTNPLESGGGVGYFATDQGPRGTLYRCAAPNTWITHYQPYQYPHPLVSGTTSPIAPPLSVSLSTATPTTRDTLIVTVQASSLRITTPVDAYVVVQAGALYLSLQLDGRLVPGLVPIARNVVLPTIAVPFAFPLAGAPPGSYTWLAAVTMPGTLTLLAPIETAPFTISQ